MSEAIQLVEYSKAPVRDGVIEGVKIVGHKSVKGYLYPQPVLRKAIPLYEGAPCYMFHGTTIEQRRRMRKHQEYFGHLANVHERPGRTGLYGDLVIKQSHPMSGLIMESDGREFGLSHLTQGTMNHDKTEVTEILEVDSVDLVDDPATTQNLREGIDDMDLKELGEANKANATEIKAIKEGQDTILQILESLKPAAPVSRITALEQVKTDGDEGEETLPNFGHSHDDFAAGLRGISGGIKV